jgi:DNA-binding NarL/FixJ family response regulator
VRAHVAALQGEVELATSLATRGLAVGRAVHDHIYPLKNLWVLGQLALAQGDAARAADYLAPLRDERHAVGFCEPGSPPFVSDAVDALVAAGRLDEARAMNDAWEQLGRKLDRPRLLATGARGRGLITAAEGDADRAVVILQEALEHHERLPVPDERARTLLALGATLRRAGHRRDARDRLDQALAAFEHLGQSLWAQRARSEIARLAGRKPADTELTATEQKVAELVAQGRSNRDVADALFITVRTVEANLTRIYRKLDVRSRAELAARWKRLDSKAESPLNDQQQRATT